MALAHPHPTKRLEKKKAQQQQQKQFYLTTFTENDTRVHYKTEGGVICSVSKGFGFLLHVCTKRVTIIEHAVCQIKTLLQHIKSH